MSMARHHAEWLSLTEVSGPFLSLPVLLRALPQGLDPHEPAHLKALRQAFDQWDENQTGKRPDPAIHRAWVQYVLGETLDLPADVIAEGQDIPEAIKATVSEHGETLRPHLMVANPPGDSDAGKPRLLIHVYPRAQALEKVVSGARWMASPATRMTELLHGSGVRLGLVTNGDQWMLVDAPAGETSGYASWYTSLWLEEHITLRSFRTLLSASRFFGVAETDTLESLLAESATDQQEVTDQLGYQVRRAVEVLVQTIDRIDKDRGRRLLAAVDEQSLYVAALTVMMRLVFLFCAEERGLLLLGDDVYDQYYAVSTLRAQLREAADQSGEEVLERRHDAWSRLLATFRGVHGGIQHEALRMPAYGGALFDPDRFPFLEGRSAGEDWQSARPLRVDNRTVLHLLEALQILRIKLPGGGPAEPRLLSFRALDIEQIGHVYEGLLDHTAVRAIEPVLGLAGSRDKEPELSLSDLERLWTKGGNGLLDFLKDETGRSVNALQKALVSEPGPDDQRALSIACDNDVSLYGRVLPFAGLLRQDTNGHPVVFSAGSVYVTQGTDRRSSGTHYTPRSLTEPIVRRALEPLVYRGVSEGIEPSPETLRTAKELLALRICDMATGSGAFLVQACRYMSERLVEAWAAAERANPGAVLITPEGDLSLAEPSERLIPADPNERLVVARRLVADRCLYGVDKNPMAVEMAKLSLWLVTMQKDRAFTFLDHSIKCGDSLVGVNKDQLRTWSMDGKGSGAPFLELIAQRGITEAIGLRRRLLQLASNDVADIREKERLHLLAEAAMKKVKLGADLIVAPSFGYSKARDQETERKRLQTIYTALPTEENTLQLRARADELLGGQRTFHWPLEFPEAFFDLNGEEGGVALEGSDRDGFDVIVGNPPFMGGTVASTALSINYMRCLCLFHPPWHGKADFVIGFIKRACGIVKQRSTVSLLLTSAVLRGESFDCGIGHLLSQEFSIIYGRPPYPWPGTANVEVVNIALATGWNGTRILGEDRVIEIAPDLTPGDAAVSNVFPLKAASFWAALGIKISPRNLPVTVEQIQTFLNDSTQQRLFLPGIGGDEINNLPDLARADHFIDPGAIASTPHLFLLKVAEIGLFQIGADYKHSAPAAALAEKLQTCRLAFACGETTVHLGFVQVPTESAILKHKAIVFPADEWGALAVLQSDIHSTWAWRWGLRREARLVYSPKRCALTFPIPKTLRKLNGVAEQYSTVRLQIMRSRDCGITRTYNAFHDAACRDADIEELRRLHVQMDNAVRDLYGWDDLNLAHDFNGEGRETRFSISHAAKQEVLRRLLKLNHERAAEEAQQAAAVVAGKPMAVLVKRTTKPTATDHPTLDVVIDEPAPMVASAKASSELPSTIRSDDIEPAILTWLVAREADMELIDGMRLGEIDKPAILPEVRLLGSVRLAKEEYALQEMAGVSVGADYTRKTWGPLSTTFHAAVERAIQMRWLIVERFTEDNNATTYSLGPDALDAIEIAFQVIGDRDQAAEDVLLYLEGDATIEAERQATVHKAWSDLVGRGLPADQDEVVKEVQAWKPDRAGFTVGELRIAYQDLRNRGYIR